MSKHVPSQVPGANGPEDASAKVGAHFRGRGGHTMPGPSVGDADGDGDDDRSPSGQRDDENRVAP